MESKFASLSLLGATVTSLVVAGTLALAPPASARGYYSDSAITLNPGAWKIDVATSHFGPDYSTIVIERVDPSVPANLAGTFVVIRRRNIYLATARDAYASDAKKVDYSDWKDMKLVQVGENAESMDRCMASCLPGPAEKRLTLRFRNIDAGMPELRSAVVLNSK